MGTVAPRRCLPGIGRSIAFPLLDRPSPKTSVPRRGFLVDGRSSVGHGEAGADRQGGELENRIAAGAPIRELVLIEPLGHARMPFAGVRPDHRAGIELAAIDAHRAAEAAADLEGGIR